MHPVTNEHAGGCPGQFTGAQHAITVALALPEAALIHFPAGIPDQHRYTSVMVTAIITPHVV